MYAFVDRPVTSLDRGCRFLMWSMRSWNAVVREGRCPGPMLAPAFAKWRMIGALQPFLRLMIAFQRDAAQPLKFCTLGCGRIAEHEAIVLSLFATVSSGNRLAARDTLDLLLCDEGAGDAFAAMTAICDTLAFADLIPSTPEILRP